MKPKDKRLDFILASASPQRKQLLGKAGYRFAVIPSHVSERHPPGLSPKALVRFLALKKALSVARLHPDQLVLGADTLVFVGSRAIGKPRNRRHAKQILKMLSGVWQDVVTGVAVVGDGGRWKRTGVCLSRVKLRTLSEREMDRVSHRHLDKAGAYSIQHKNDRFVEKLRGDYDNVVGLPLRVVKSLLRSARQRFSKIL